MTQQELEQTLAILADPDQEFDWDDAWDSIDQIHPDDVELIPTLLQALEAASFVGQWAHQALYRIHASTDERNRYDEVLAERSAIVILERKTATRFIDEGRYCADEEHIAALLRVTHPSEQVIAALATLRQDPSADVVVRCRAWFALRRHRKLR